MESLVEYSSFILAVTIAATVRTEVGKQLFTQESVLAIGWRLATLRHKDIETRIRSIP